MTAGIEGEVPFVRFDRSLSNDGFESERFTEPNDRKRHRHNRETRTYHVERSTMTTADSLVRAAVLVAAVLLVPVLMLAFVLPFAGFGHVGSAGTGGTVRPLLLWPIVLVVLGGGYLLYGTIAGSGGEDGAIAELRSTYARGEIDTGEFEERRERLQRTE